MALLSLPPLSIPGLSFGSPTIDPTPTIPILPTGSNTFTVPSITISFPGPPTTTPVVPTARPTTTVSSTSTRPSTPTVPISEPSSSNIPTEPSTPPSSPESSPPNESNLHGGTSTSTSTTTQGVPPTGQLSPSQPTMPFLENKGAKAGVFSVVGVVTLALIVGIVAVVYHRRKRKRFDLEHVEAMVGYQTRAPIDGDDDEDPSSHGHSHTNPSYYKTSSEGMAPSSATHFMQERNHDDVPVFLPAHASARPPEEYDPYREGPFSDYYVTTSANRYGSQPLDTEADQEQKAESRSDSSHLDPPRHWPQLGQLPPAFGSPSSETSVEYPRPALRVTNGFDDSRA